MNNKILRINEDIQREMSMILRNVKDPRICRQGMISITAVDTTSDLRQSKIYISLLEPESEKDLMKGLKSASGYLRNEIGKVLNLRHVPELQFIIDNSMTHGARILSLLSELPETSASTIILDVVQTADWLSERDNFLIITHRRPDGDTTGSAGALAQGLREYGKTAYVQPNPELTPRYKPFVEEYFKPEDFEPDFTIIVDTASKELIHESINETIDKIDLCIDHHSSNKKYAKYTCLDSDLSSCGELIYDILIELSDEISSKTAKCLYVAVSTDTGCFAYANTTANSLQTAALLVEAGAPQKEINKTLFRTKTMSRVKIEGIIYSNIEFLYSGKAAIVTITGDMMTETGASEDDVDDVSAIPVSIEGVCIGITLRELKSPTDGKGSIRTIQGYNANEIAAYFGGGGHPLAAGFSFNDTIENIRDRLLNILPGFISAE